MRKVKIIAMLIAAFFLLSAFITAEAEQADFMQEGEKILSDNERLASGLSVSAGDSSSQEDIQSGNTYYDKLIAQELKERQYAIYTNQLKAQLVDYQITYLTTWEAELSEKYKIEKAKLDLGYTTSIAVDVAHNQYTVAGHQIQTAMA